MGLSLALLALLGFNNYILHVTARYHNVRRQNNGDDPTGHAAYVDTAVRVAAPKGLVNHAAYIDSQMGGDDNEDTPSAVSATYSGLGLSPTVISSSAVASSTSSTASSSIVWPSLISTASPTILISTPMPTTSTIPSAIPNPADARDAVNPSRDSITSPDSACQEALAAMHGSISNPSGIAACYNVMMFDNTTGLFQSVLGLYQVGAAIGEWGSIPEADINVGVIYPWATVAGQNTQNAKRNALSPSHNSRDRILLRKRDAPLLMKDMNFIGQVDTIIGEMTNETAMMVAVMPVVTLSGTSANGTVITTTLPDTDASFVTGVFIGMDQPNTTTTAVPAVATQPTTPTAAAPFSYPGVTLGISPVGLIVTSSWAFLFILFVGLGTIGRMRVRAVYRRRQKEAHTESLPGVPYSMFTVLVNGIKDGNAAPYRL